MTLRERLARRRARKAAGLPPPDPVTVTESFFTSNITRTKNTECSECKATFVPHGRQVTCSKACYDARVARTRNKGNIRLVCEECMTPFWGRDQRAVVCSPECRAERKRRLQRAWARAKGNKPSEPLTERLCAAGGCEVVFTPVRPSQATCGAERCVREYRRERNRIHDKTWRERKRQEAQRYFNAGLVDYRLEGEEAG